jgi:hypothetical protein
MKMSNALELALEALRKAMQGNLMFDEAMEAFNALKEAIKQQEVDGRVQLIAMLDLLNLCADQLNNHLDRLGKACVAGTSAPTIPEGWQLVPKELTEEMLDAFIGEIEASGSSGELRGAFAGYAAMLSAAPKGETA